MHCVGTRSTLLILLCSGVCALDIDCQDFKVCRRTSWNNENLDFRDPVLIRDVSNSTTYGPKPPYEPITIIAGGPSLSVASIITSADEIPTTATVVTKPSVLDSSATGPVTVASSSPTTASQGGQRAVTTTATMTSSVQTSAATAQSSSAPAPTQNATSGAGRIWTQMFELWALMALLVVGM